MVKRSSNRNKIDDTAFPIRVKVKVPERGHGVRLDQYSQWLASYVGVGSYAWHSGTTLGGSASSVYFRDLSEAKAFLSQFPSLELADATDKLPYNAVQVDEWKSEDFLGVCNLYSMTSAQSAIRALFSDLDDLTGNLPALEAIYPDYPAPVIHRSENGLMMSMMRWGMPSPAFALKGKKTDRGVTNIRNTKSPHWRRWLSVRHRCVVPFTSFAEPHKPAGGSFENVWFHLPDQEIAFFAGIWTEWTSVRKLKEGEITANLFGFLTAEPNTEVGAVHPKAMPVILRSKTDVSTWLNAPETDATLLQRPLPDGSLSIIQTPTDDRVF